MIKYSIEYASEAVRDLDNVFSDVFEVSKDLEITHKYLDDLLDAVESLVKRPKTGTPLFYDDLFTGYYYIRFKEYLVFYRIDDKKMLVDRILYRKCDYLRLLFKSNES